MKRGKLVVRHEISGLITGAAIFRTTVLQNRAQQDGFVTAVISE